MPNITEMNPTEFRELLHTLVNEELFKSRERLAALLAKDSSREALEAEVPDAYNPTKHIRGIQSTS